MSLLLGNPRAVFAKFSGRFRRLQERRPAHYRYRAELARVFRGIGTYSYSPNTDPGLAGDTGVSGPCGTTYRYEGLKLGAIEGGGLVIGPPNIPRV